MPDTEFDFQPLDVGLINGRGHVQGSEMLACIMALPELDASLNWSIERAQFHRMTGCIVGIDRAATSLDINRHIASVVATSDGHRTSFFLRAIDKAAPARTIADTYISRIEPSSAARAPQQAQTFVYSGVAGYRAVLEAVVQSAKLWVRQSVPGSTRHMFTSLGANTLVRFPDEGWADGRITIERLRRVHTASAIQTMNRFDISAREGRSSTGVFGFAYRPPEDNRATSIE